MIHQIQLYPGEAVHGIDLACYLFDSLPQSISASAPIDKTNNMVIRCLEEYIIGGIPTTINLLIDILKTKEFVNSQIHVKFLEENFEIRDMEERPLTFSKTSFASIITP